MPISEAHLINNMEYMKTIPDKSMDLILIDPPYGTTNLPWDKKQDYEKLFDCFFRIAKENAAILIFSQQPIVTDVINACRKYFRYEIIWEKSIKMGFGNVKKMPLRGHENILVFYKKLPVYNPQKSDFGDKPKARKRRSQPMSLYAGYSDFGEHTSIDDGLRFAHSVIYFSNHNGMIWGQKRDSNMIHQTQKPLDLIKWLIMSYTNEGANVLDCYMGSGTTRLACYDLGRNFYGCELDPDYFADGCKRFENHKLQIKIELPDRPEPTQTQLI